MDWCMNHQDISVHSVPKESTNTLDQTICRGIIPQIIGFMTDDKANSSFEDTFA